MTKRLTVVLGLLCIISITGASCAKPTTTTQAPTSAATSIATSAVAAATSSQPATAPSPAPLAKTQSPLPPTPPLPPYPTIQTTTTASPDLKFTPDSGVRIDNASNPAARVNKDGSISLLYQDLTDHRTKVARSAEGMGFPPGSEANPHHFRAMALPDGTYRSYIWEPRAGGLVSETSRDGVSFSPDAGVRYALQPDDKGQMGVYDLFVDRSGGVVLLYIGDMFGLNNIRRAYSKDNGWTFTFDRGNILGDAAFGGGGRSFVDQKAIVLSDGRIRLFTMKAGTLFSFISADDGRTFSQENFQLRPQDFKEQRLVSLHDPQPVRLPDGRYRIYVTGIVDDGRPAGQSDRNAKQVIVSATTER